MVDQGPIIPAAPEAPVVLAVSNGIVGYIGIRERMGSGQPRRLATCWVQRLPVALLVHIWVVTEFLTVH